MKNSLFDSPRSWGLVMAFGLIGLGLGLLSPLSAFGQSSSAEVFERVELNLTNAKSNREDSQKNLQIINDNLSQVFQAREHLTKESNKVQTALDSNLKTLGEIDKGLTETLRYEEQEKNFLKSEDARIVELEKALTQLKASSEQRRQKLDASSKEREKLQASQVEWKARADGLKKLVQEAKTRNDRLNSEEKEWSRKKNSYEKDIERWNKLVDNQEKVKANLTALKSQ